jgi:hypothetical protein
LAFEASIGQDVTLRRNPSIVVYNAMTWNMGKLGFTSSTRYAAEVRKLISEILDNFLNDYLSVNPK